MHCFKNNQVDNETCIKCLKCIDKCPKGAMKFSKHQVKFSPKRREFILAMSAFVLFATALETGAKISKNFVKKALNIILPPGAKDANSMANKCLNCNLCVENCPNKILTKADKEFPAVHIDYSKGKGYCEYNCSKCSQVCPSGAIERISPDEKQKIRIAMAQISDEKCVRCRHCIKECPYGAISKIDDKIIINSQKCVGCAKCTKVCPTDAIGIYGVNEQRRI